jgi:hypothetical protein
MNFTITWVLDKFGFVPKFEKTELQEWPFPVAKKATKVAAKKTLTKKTVKKK